MMRVVPFSEAKDWGSTRQRVWFSWMQANGSTDTIEKVGGLLLSVPQTRDINEDKTGTSAS